MALRMTIHGVQVVGDTPQEVAELILALKDHSQSMQDPLPARKPVIRPVARAKPAPGLFKANEISRGAPPLTGSHRETLMALKEAFPHGVSSDQIASRIEKTRSSIPIIMIALREYGKKLGVDAEQVVVRTAAERGQKGSIYTLTEKAMRAFF